MNAPLQSAGLLVIRVVLGVVFLAHGTEKLGDLQGTEQFVASLDIPAPALMAPRATFTEVIGGGLLIVGLLTPLVGVALAIKCSSPGSPCTPAPGSSSPTAATSSCWCSAPRPSASPRPVRAA